MKRLLLKIPAMLAMLISLVSLFFYVQSFFDWANPDAWLLSSLIAMFSVPFFLVDAIVSLVKAKKKEDPGFHCILALVLVGAIPMVVIFGGDGKDAFNAIWNAYYLLMLALEGISIKKACAPKNGKGISAP